MNDKQALAVRLFTFIKGLREHTTYYREGDPYQFTALERGVRGLVADDLEAAFKEEIKQWPGR